MQIETFFNHLWDDYTSLTPQAARIHRLFIDDGNQVVNDHVALRTYNLAPIDISSLEPILLNLGYQRFAPYHFESKKLDAWSYTHADPGQPLLFLSELRVQDLTESSRDLIQKLCSQVEKTDTLDESIFWRGRPWAMPKWEDYQSLLAESEYAAWVAVTGIRANHFTISVNHLHTPDLDYVISLLKKSGIALNSVGGIIKGTEIDLLMQCSTLADTTELQFPDGTIHTVTTCYYEFARRFNDTDGLLYRGFVPASADRIFHSTDQQG